MWRTLSSAVVRSSERGRTFVLHLELPLRTIDDRRGLWWQDRANAGGRNPSTVETTIIGTLAEARKATSMLQAELLTTKSLRTYVLLPALMSARS